MAYVAATAVAFAQRQTGRYSDGQCWTLVEDAVVGAGGRSSRGLTPNFGPNVSYVWGTPVAVSGLQAGDVIQFMRYSWTQSTTVDITNPDGSGSTDTQSQTEARGLPHHSAMVVSVGAGGMVEVVEQNIPPLTGGVQTAQLLLSAPAPATTTTRVPRGTGFVVTITTVTHSISGTVRCYRPIAV